MLMSNINDAFYYVTYYFNDSKAGYFARVFKFALITNKPNPH